ncbi:uncharacterized protein B0T15DRAFT_568540 [Chaetomium strumarium]|uniref:DUF7924 domain-containing protein n=1 Tax=Chaetomium strumarium TaxID=1170767 RepID=A0AAJ0GRK4_9PEZI|nr:hypothetical protein B0T15DRAFT_568540 [Chaetomium strumarium]
MAHTRAQTAAQRALLSPASNHQGSSRKRASRHAERNRLRPTIPSETPTAPVQSRGRRHPDPEPDPKRRWTSPPRPAEVAFSEPAIGSSAHKHTDPEQDWPEETSETDLTMDHLLARKKSSSNLSRKQSNSATSTTPSDQKPRDEKSAPYRHQRYETLLEVKGSYMTKAPLGLPVPGDTLFPDDIFETICQRIHNRNKARVIQDISRLIVPSAESLATFGTKHLDILTESVNEGWNNSIPFTSTRPQPDYSVKCGAAALDIADRQNAHSMTLAVPGIVELFCAVKREDEVNRKILAFSVSHDHTSVRIYGHYPVIAGKDTKYYRHPIHKFDFTALDGKDKWTAYRFTKNVYDIWMPKHFEHICSAINQLPSDLDFDVPPLSKATGLSQDLRDLMQSDASCASIPDERGSQSSNVEPEADTPGTSFSEPKRNEPKRRKG